VTRTTFGSLPWRSRSQYDLQAKWFLAHNFVIWSRILQLFHRNDHHIETTCLVQHLGCYLEGQGHSMTLQQNRVWPKTLLFEVTSTTFDKLLLCVQYLFGEHYPVPTGSCFYKSLPCIYCILILQEKYFLFKIHLNIWNKSLWVLLKFSMKRL